LPGWRAFLLDRHIDRCPRCQGEALGDAAIRPLGVTPSDLQDETQLSPFAAGAEQPQARTFRLGWRYVFGVFLAAVALWTVVVVSRLAPPAAPVQGMVTVMEGEADACVFAVLESRIGNEPARPIFFKPRQPGMTIVWFEKTKNLN
jgi:hypothetical protein